MSAQPAPTLEEEIAGVAGSVCDLDDAKAHNAQVRMFAMSYLWRHIGADMLVAGKTSLERDGFRYRLKLPRDKEYCVCHMALLYQCPDGPAGYRAVGTVVKPDALPDFWVTRAKKGVDE